MKKLLIIGQGRHGKDTVADLLCERYGMKSKSSSEFACDKFIFDKLKRQEGYFTPKECYEDRHNHRDMWFNLICEYNKEDPSKLTEELLQEHNIYTGMRSILELESCIEKDIFDYIIWVDASKRVDYVEPTSSNNITKDVADIIIYNNGTLQDLEAQVDTLYHEVINYV